jgi:hypothetical protein
MSRIELGRDGEIAIIGTAIEMLSVMEIMVAHDIMKQDDFEGFIDEAIKLSKKGK